MSSCRRARSCRPPPKARMTLARQVVSHLARRKDGGRPVLRRRPVRAAHRRICARHRRRRRRGCRRGTRAKRRRTPGLRPIDAQARDLFRRPLVAQELQARRGRVRSAAARRASAGDARSPRARCPSVVAVSCNPTTFARDAKDSDRRRLSADGGHADRPVPLLNARRDRGQIRALS